MSKKSNLYSAMLAVAMATDHGHGGLIPLNKRDVTPQASFNNPSTEWKRKICKSCIFFSTVHTCNKRDGKAHWVKPKNKACKNYKQQQ